MEVGSEVERKGGVELKGSLDEAGELTQEGLHVWIMAVNNYNEYTQPNKYDLKTI